MSKKKKHVVLRLVSAFSRLASDVGLSARTTAYCLNRFKREGVRFFVATLPTLAKAVLRGLETGKFNPRDCTSFARKGGLLREFRGYLALIFDHSGNLLANPCVTSLWALRQLCDYMYKLAFSFSDDQLAVAIGKYKLTEQRVSDFRVDRGWIKHLRANLHTYYREFCDTPIERVLARHRPRFTSGSFAGSSKLDVPFYGYKKLPDSKIGTTTTSFAAVSGFAKAYPSSPSPVVVMPDENRVCEVLFVPKDARGPRVISKEPLHALRMQMSYHDWSASTLQRLTRGRIQFCDQSKNQQMAYTASLRRDRATLDLKDASDSVSYTLVAELFQWARAPWWFLNHTRSQFAKLPTGETIRLAKLAGMGSGLTFPTMALLIHLSICTLVSRRGLATFEEAMAEVYVFGDDVIVPTPWYATAVDALSRSGLQVNMDKSFRKGHFRESCGGDYYRGNEVNPVRLKFSNGNLGEPSNEIELSSPLRVVELERHCRELVRAGLIQLSAYYYALLEEVLACVGLLLHSVSGDAPWLGRYQITPVRSDDPDSRVRVLQPLPVVTDGEMCPYKFLGDKWRSELRQGAQPPRWVDTLGLESQSRSVYGEMAIPRRLKLRKVKVAQWLLDL